MNCFFPLCFCQSFNSSVPILVSCFSWRIYPCYLAGKFYLWMVFFIIFRHFYGYHHGDCFIIQTCTIKPLLQKPSNYYRVPWCKMSKSLQCWPSSSGCLWIQTLNLLAHKARILLVFKQVFLALMCPLGGDSQKTWAPLTLCPVSKRSSLREVPGFIWVGFFC